MPAPLAIRLRTANGDWTTLGGESARGIVPERLSLSANEQGPDTCTFSLRRRTRTAWPDLRAYNQCEIEVAGAVVWGGRIWETPTTDDDAISVQGRGWQYHLDDRLTNQFWVQSDLTRYQDSRSLAATTLSYYRTGCQVQSGDGVLLLSMPKSFAVAVSDRVGVTLDTGISGAIDRVVVSWERIYNDANDTLYSRASDSADGSSAGDDSTAVMSSAASGTIAHSPSSRRYHHLFVIRTATAGTLGEDHGARITGVKLFGSTAWESGNASILKASDIFNTVALTLGPTTTPLLSTAYDRIETSSFSIPDFQPDGYRSVREILQAANAYHDWLWGVGPDRKIYFRSRPTTPIYEMGAWSGAPFSDASSNSADDLFNEVVVQYQDAAGQQQNEVRTATASLLTQQGFTRSKVLAVQSALTQAAAQQIGDVWLTNRAVTPLRGGVSAFRGSVRQTSGASVHPAHLLLGVGERLRLTDRVNPDTGAWGRDGAIVGVTYDHDSETASLQIDDRNDRLETLLQRLAVVTGQIRN